MKLLLKTLILLVCFFMGASQASAQRIYVLQLQGVQTADNAVFGDWLDNNFYGAPAFSSNQIAHHVLGHPAGMQRGYISSISPPVPGAPLAGLPPLGCNDYGTGC